MSGIEQTTTTIEESDDISQLIDDNVKISNEKETGHVDECTVTTVTPLPTTTPEINEIEQIPDNVVTDETQSTQIESTTDDDSVDAKSLIVYENVDENQKLPETTSNETVITNIETPTTTTTAVVATPVRSRELKSILALSKEAKLDTNLTHRRKTIDLTTKRDGGHTTMSSRKLMKTTNFPVTAESELDYYENNDNEKTNNNNNNNERTPKKVGRKRKQSDDVVSSCSSGIEGAAEMRKNPGLLNLTPLKPNKDVFCWRCHRDNVNVVCETCPRAYHYKCLKQIITDTEHWPCPECVSILKAENTQTRSKAMKGMTLDHLCSLLKYAVKRMIQCDGSEPFIHPVDEKQFPEYKSYIVQPMDLTMLEKNIKNNLYGSTQAFEADAKWILHNSIIFNSYQSKLTSTAKTILKICKQEMAEIENCPSCYLNANTKKHTWFVEVCPKPHLLVWAKLKGFPYWPAKMMSFNATGMVDVRFFGAHDKAWVSTKDCYLYSLKDPNSGKQKRNDIIECVKELEIYVENLKRIYGKVVYAPFKTPIEAGNEDKYLKSFLPTYYDVINKNKKEMIIKDDDDDDGNDNNDEIIKEIDRKEQIIDANTSSDQESPNKSKENMENITEMNENPLKQIPKTRIECRFSTGSKPKWAVKPLKNVEIKKRHSSDTFVDISTKHLDDTNSNEIKSEIDTTEQEQQKSQSPPIKFKISDQLIQKLGDLSKQISKNIDNKSSDDTYDDDDDDDGGNESADMEIDDSLGVAVEENEIETQEKLEESIEIDGESTVKDIEIIEKVSNVDNVEKCEANEGEKEKIVLNIDENNIRNIIHSSLIKPVESLIAPEKTDENTDDEIKGKKRKRPEDENEDDSPPEKVIKLIPEEKENNDHVDETIEGTEENQMEDKMKNIEEIDSEKDKETNNTDTIDKINPITIPTVQIKNEAESGEEQDVEYMEAKRQYMSALNISEKQKLPSKPKLNEIRTRSKTEEKRTKTNNDNNYPNQLNKIIDKCTSESSSSDIECNRKLSSIENNSHLNEIYIKSLTKIQAPKHKARKSFPTPNYNKRNVKILPKPLDHTTRKLLSNNAQTRTCNTSLTVLPKLHYNRTDMDNSKNVPRSNIPCPPLQPSITITTNDCTNNETQNECHHSNNNSSNLLINTSTITTDSSNQLDNELSVLKEILPENVSKCVGEILCQSPPKLKPKPSSILNSTFDSSSLPSSAGPISSRINSMTQTLNDCFRGLIVDVVNDLGKSNNPEATITSLKLEIEELNYRHSIELAEIRRNVAIMLKDIQKSIVEERKRVINETRANCEIEAAKRVEEAKSKQWCANCSKEAQFYCCWNTSYCDYPCQQKHWLKHMSKCTQVTNQNQSLINSSTNNRPTNQQKSTASNSSRFRNVLSKPQKVYVKRSSVPCKGQSSSNHMALVESAPGNFELIGNGSVSVNGKILAATLMAEKRQNNSNNNNNVVAVTAPSSGTSVELTTCTNSNNNDNNNIVTVSTISPVSKNNVASSSDSEQ